MSVIIRRDAETVAISIEDYNSLIARSNTLYAHFGGEYRLCPNCKKYMIVRGLVCYGCGYDPTFEENQDG